MWVWLYHAWLVAGLRPVYIESIGLKLTPFFSLGWIGGDLFFVISGFVLSWPYVGVAAREFSFSDFMRRRALRVLPAYYAQFAILLMFAAAGFLWDLPSWKNALAHVLLLHNLVQDWANAINQPWWTLPIEWQFYLVFPLMLALLARFGAWRLLPCIVAITLLWRFGAFEWLRFHSPAATVAIKVWLLGQLPGYVCEFLFGMAAAWVLACWWPRLAKARWRELLSLSGLLASIALTIGWMYVLDARATAYWQGHWLVYVWNPIAGLFLALLLCSLALDGKLARMLFANSAMLWLGKISYSLYLWHFAVLEVMVHLKLFGEGAPDTILARVTLYSLGPVLLVAWLSWRCTEHPFQRYRQQSAAILIPGLSEMTEMATAVPRNDEAGRGTLFHSFGRLVRHPWRSAAIAGALLVFGSGLADRYQQPPRDALTSCTQRGAIDLPQTMNAADSTIHVAGWVHDWEPRNRIRRVVLSAGGVDFAEMPVELARQDVVSALPNCRIGRPGFDVQLPLARIPSRVEPVIVHAERKDGTRFEIGRITWSRIAS